MNILLEKLKDSGGTINEGCRALSDMLAEDWYDVSPATLRSIAYGTQRPSVDLVLALATVLKLELEDFRGMFRKAE